MPSAEVGERGAQEPRFELLAVGAVVDPFARRRDPLAGRNGCGMAHHRYDITMAARLGAQNAEAVLGVVIGDGDGRISREARLRTRKESRDREKS